MHTAEQAAAAVSNRFILRTDIAGGSRLAEMYPEQYHVALEGCQEAIHQALATYHGEVLPGPDDGCLALFQDAGSAVGAAVELQLALTAAGTGSAAVLPADAWSGVTCAVHTGRLIRLPQQDQGWFGSPLNRCLCISELGHPGQVLLSETVRSALKELPPQTEALDLGRVRLSDLSEPLQLFQLWHPGFPLRQFPPLSGLDSHPNNLAVQPHAFIGRRREIEELSRLLAGETRLLTLHAPGGYGKSRLASQLLARELWRFEHGAFEVLLASVWQYGHLPEALANATGFQYFGSREPQQQILDFLRHKELLLCLDNLDHLPGAAEFIELILETAPRVRIVATSREPLRLAAEHVYPVAPLPLGPGSDSVQLFADRAALAQRGFMLDPESTLWVERICERLEGIPLSIELAAAWVDSFTLPEMFAQLGQQLQQTAQQPGAAEYQLCVRASCDRSYGLLRPELQRALRRLSVCQGGFFADAAQDLLGLRDIQLHQVLSALRDKSWLFVRDTEWDNPGHTLSPMRYYLRDTTSHEYAWSQLCAPENTAEREQAVAAHAAHYVALLEREGLRLEGGGTPDGGAAQLAALQRLSLEHSNIIAAFEAAISLRELDLLLPLAKHLGRYLDLRSKFLDQRERYSSLLETARELGNSELELWAQQGLVLGWIGLGHYCEAKRLLEQIVEQARRLGDRYAESIALRKLGVVEHTQGNFSESRMLYEQCLALACELGDRFGQACALGNIASIDAMQGHYSTARERFEQSITLSRELGDQRAEACSLLGIGNVEDSIGNSSAARTYYEQALTRLREIGDRTREASCLIGFGNVEDSLGNYSAAVTLYTQALARFRELGDRSGEAYSLHNLGAVERKLGNFSATRSLIDQSLPLWRELGDRCGEAHSLNALGMVECEQSNYAAARTLLEQAVQIRSELGDRDGEAHSLLNLGHLAYVQAAFPLARTYFAQALTLRRELGLQSDMAESCACAGSVLAALGRPRESALGLFGAQAVAGSLAYQLQPEVQQVLDAGLAQLDLAAASGAISAHEIAQIRVQAEEMNIEELADDLLAALASAVQEQGA